MKKMNILLLLACYSGTVLVAGIAPSRPGQEVVAMKTAWVDMSKIFNPEKLEEAPEEVRDAIQNLQKELTDRVSNIKKQKDAFDKQKSEIQKMGERASASKVDDLRKMQANLDLEMQAAEAFQGRAFQELQQEMFPKVQKAAEAVAKRAGWDAVDYMPKLYMNSKFDITSEVIAELNKEYRAQKAAQKFKK